MYIIGVLKKLKVKIDFFQIVIEVLMGIWCRTIFFLYFGDFFIIIMEKRLGDIFLSYGF